MPVRLPAKALEKVWGSHDLSPLFPRSAAKIGEIWFDAQGALPLLVKFLFTSEKLSVQVHPDDAYAQEHEGGSLGKTEMWHVLRADPGARIAAGFRRPVTPEQLRAAAQSGEIEDMLQWIEVHPGDTVFVPAGTVHAIGGGLALCEIQQHSDVTYRLYDYGRPRDLHLERGAAVADGGCHPGIQAPQGAVLVDCGHFHVEKHELRGRQAQSGARTELLVFLSGAGTVAGEPFAAGEVWLARAGEPPFELAGEATLLEANAP